MTGTERQSTHVRKSRRGDGGGDGLRASMVSLREPHPNPLQRLSFLISPPCLGLDVLHEEIVQMVTIQCDIVIPARVSGQPSTDEELRRQTDHAAANEIISAAFDRLEDVPWITTRETPHHDENFSSPIRWNPTQGIDRDLQGILQGRLTELDIFLRNTLHGLRSPLHHRCCCCCRGFLRCVRRSVGRMFRERCRGGGSEIDPQGRSSGLQLREMVSDIPRQFRETFCDLVVSDDDPKLGNRILIIELSDELLSVIQDDLTTAGFEVIDLHRS